MRHKFLVTAAAATTATHLIATHLPSETAAKLLFGIGGGSINELIHFAVYFLSATLWWFAYTDRYPTASIKYQLITFVPPLAVLAFADEITQPAFGRSAELIDFLADLAGIVAGICSAIVVKNFFAISYRKPQPVGRP